MDIGKLIFLVKNNRTLIEIAQEAHLPESWIALRIKEASEEHPILIPKEKCEEYQNQYGKIVRQRAERALEKIRSRENSDKYYRSKDSQ